MALARLRPIENGNLTTVVIKAAIIHSFNFDHTRQANNELLRTDVERVFGKLDISINHHGFYLMLPDLHDLSKNIDVVHLPTNNIMD